MNFMINAERQKENLWTPVATHSVMRRPKVGCSTLFVTAIEHRLVVLHVRAFYMTSEQASKDKID